MISLSNQSNHVQSTVLTETQVFCGLSNQSNHSSSNYTIEKSDIPHSFGLWGGYLFYKEFPQKTGLFGLIGQSSKINCLFCPINLAAHGLFGQRARSHSGLAHAAVNNCADNAAPGAARIAGPDIGCIIPVAHLPLKSPSQASPSLALRSRLRWNVVGNPSLVSTQRQRGTNSDRTVGSRADAPAATITPSVGGLISYPDRWTPSPSCTINQPKLKGEKSHGAH